MSDEQVLKMPVRRFWLMEGNISRLMAEKDIRNLTVAVSAQGEEAAESHRKNLFIEIKDESPEDLMSAELDRDSVEDLRSML